MIGSRFGHLLIFVPPTAADASCGEAEERQQGAADNPVTQGIFLLEERAYHVIGLSRALVSLKNPSK